MQIDDLINEKIQRLQDLNKQMTKIAEKIGALQEEGKALHGVALQLKGAIEGLAELKNKDEQEKADKAKGLILPDKALVAADGKTVIAAPTDAAPAETAPTAEAAPAAPEAPAAQTPAEEPKTPITLEVK